MPHDAKGRKIEVGDVIKTRPVNFPGTPLVVGPIVKIRANEQHCTGEVRWIGAGQLDQDYFDAANSELVLKADGTEPKEPVSLDVIGGARYDASKIVS